MSNRISPQRLGGAEKRVVCGDAALKVEIRLKSQIIIIGDIAITRGQDHKLWLSHRRGERMALSKENKLAKVLEDFFWKEF